MGKTCPSLQFLRMVACMCAYVCLYWRRLVKNIGWAKQNIGGKGGKIDKCMVIIGGHVPGLAPQSLRLCTLVRVCMCMYVCAWLYVYATSALTSLKRQRLRVCVLANVLACVTLSG